MLTRVLTPEQEEIKKARVAEKAMIKSRLKWGIQKWCSKSARDPMNRSSIDRPRGTYFKGIKGDPWKQEIVEEG